LADETPGLVKVKPADGHSVQTEQGWMVPYENTIPGTDVKYRMIPIPGGEYVMGSPETEPGRNADEGPQRKVVVEPFWMGECEVTWSEYKLFMELYRSLKEFESLRIRKLTDENQIDAITAPTPLYEPDFTFEFGDNPQQPAVSMTQYSAKQYTKWLSAISSQQFRLPTEAEWEYACRAGSSTAFSFGDDASKLDEFAWFSENTNEEGTRVVRQKKPNAFGLYDMHGNVAEWVIDGYADYKSKDGFLNAATDWVRTDKPDPRVVRGGSWEFPASQCRSASRLGSNDEAWKEFDPNLPRSPWWYTTDPARGVGFRLLRALKPLPREEIEEFWKIDAEDIQYDVGDRLSEGRGVRGLADKDLPQAILDLKK
jgi:formylglycine-generating enzyme required for sulfatase activity